MRDPNILSIAEAARLTGKDPHNFSKMLKDDPELALKLVIDLPCTRTLISRPRLMRLLHGEHWREDVAS